MTNQPDQPSRLEDPYLYSGTTILEKDGVTLEVLDGDVAEYKALGFTVKEPGQPKGQTSSIDKAKVQKFAQIKRFFWGR